MPHPDIDVPLSLSLSLWIPCFIDSSGHVAQPMWQWLLGILIPNNHAADMGHGNTQFK